MWIMSDIFGGGFGGFGDIFDSFFGGVCWSPVLLSALVVVIWALDSLSLFGRSCRRYKDYLV